MAIGANSYGTVAEVEALVPRYTTSGSFDGSSRPTLTQVEKFIDRVSGVLNVLLAEYGFSVPVTQADAKLALDHFAVDQAQLLAHAANGAGPYAPGSQELRRAQKTASQMILAEAEAFLEGHAQGLELLGATRSRGLTYGLKVRTVDDSGDTIVPPFQRKQVEHYITDWDTDE